MYEKRKIIDCVIFNGDTGMLKYRLNETNAFVELFIIIDNTNKLKVEELCVEKSKVIITNFEDFKPNVLKIGLEYEDIIMISNDNEVPDFSTLDNDNFLDGHYVFLKQRKHTYCINSYEHSEHIGTLVVSFSSFLISKNIVNLFIRKSLYSKSIYNGRFFSNNLEFISYNPKIFKIILKDFNILIPPTQYYSNTLTEKYGFGEVFKINELKEELKKYKPVNDDLFVFVNERKEFKWSEIKDKFLSELLLN